MYDLYIQTITYLNLQVGLLASFHINIIQEMLIESLKPSYFGHVRRKDGYQAHCLEHPIHLLSSRFREVNFVVDN